MQKSSIELPETFVSFSENKFTPSRDENLREKKFNGYNMKIFFLVLLCIVFLYKISGQCSLSIPPENIRRYMKATLVCNELIVNSIYALAMNNAVLQISVSHILTFYLNVKQQKYFIL